VVEGTAEADFKPEMLPPTDEVDESEVTEPIGEIEATAALQATSIGEPMVKDGKRAITEEPAAEPPFVPEKEDDLHAAVTVGTPIEEEEEEPAISTSPSGVITPSKARVRVAGSRLPIGDHTWAAVDILLDEPALRAM
jgi:hypothetical protein